MRAFINCRFWQRLCQRILWSFTLVFFNDLPGLWVLISWLVHSIFSLLCTRLFFYSYSFYISLSLGLKMSSFTRISSLYSSSQRVPVNSYQMQIGSFWFQMPGINSGSFIRLICPKIIGGNISGCETACHSIVWLCLSGL